MKRWIIGGAALLAGLLAFAPGAWAQTVKDVHIGTVLNGELTDADLEGKVVLVEKWGVN